MQTIAAIDTGSNAIRMAVGRLTDDGRVEVIDNLRMPVRLGQDSFTSGRIGEQTMQAAVEAFSRFRKVSDDFNVAQMRAVATSALREAANSDILVDRIARAAGINLEIISEEEESRLIHLAVTKALDLKGKHAVLIDIGGGSVEVIISEGENILSTESYLIGTVRLLLKLDGNQPTRAPFNRLLREYAEATRTRIDREIGKQKVDVCIGTGGNVEEMGELRKRLFDEDNGHVIELAELRQLVKKLDGMTVEERIRKLKLRPDRADVILPAAVVLHMIAREARAKEVLIPNVGLKDGLLWDMAPLAAGPRLPRRDQVWGSAMRMGLKYQFEANHSVLVARLATRLFDQSHALHDLNEGDRLLLEIASLLHDIGHFINTINHDKHGYYLLKNNLLIGLTEQQQDVVANVVRYHRKSAPSVQDENFKSLPQKDRLRVTKLSALMRLADGMDVSHTGRVRDALLEKGKGCWHLRLEGEGDLMLERWTSAKRRSLFQDVFGVELEIVEN